MITKKVKRVAVSILAGSLVPSLFWLGGFNFDERGFNMVYCAICTLLAALAAHILQAIRALDDGS